MEVFDKGMQLDPSNAALKKAMDDMVREWKGAQPGGGPGDMFTGPEAEAKLMSNPKTAKHFADPQFKAMWAMIKQNPQLMMQMM